MRILFQTIGVLVQYNWALPYYLSTLHGEIKIDNLANLFSYLMGGYYYHLKSLGKVTPIFEETGMKRTGFLNRAFKVTKKFVIKEDYDIIHLNRYDRELLIQSSPKIFTLHSSLDEPSSSACNMLREIQKYVDVIIAPTSHCAKTVKEVCGLDAKVIHHGIDTEIFNPYIIPSIELESYLNSHQTRN